MALGLDGLRVGCWTSPDGLSGATVVLPPPGTLGAVAVRGAAPGTREAVALGPSGKIEVCHAVVLAGGSAFGLAAADGAMAWLEEHGVGYETQIGIVPIVGAAIVFDGSVAVPGSRPDAAAGRAACEAATEDEPAEGGVGVGAGCSVAVVGGIEHAWASGQGVAVVREGGVTVGALVANNALGEVVGEDGTMLAGSRAPDGAPRFPAVALRRDADVEPDVPGGPPANTVIGCVVTDARLTKTQAVRVADLAHSGVARAVRPAHTSFDGDAMFCLSTGGSEVGVDLVAALAADAVAAACRRAVEAARGRHGLPGLADG